MLRNMQDLPHPFLPSTPVTFPVRERSQAPLRTSCEPKERRMLSAEVEDIADNGYEKTNSEINEGIKTECHLKQFPWVLSNIDVEVILPFPCHQL